MTRPAAILSLADLAGPHNLSIEKPRAHPHGDSDAGLILPSQDALGVLESPMSAEVATVPIETQVLQKFSPNDARIAEVRASIAGVLAKIPELVEAEDEATLKETKSKVVVPLRKEIDICHEELKRDALRFSQAVDAVKRRLRGLVAEFEKPINDAIEEIQTRQRKRAEEKIKAEEALLEQERKAREAAEEALREAERQKIAAEQEQARKKLEEERRLFEAEKAKRDAEDKARREAIEAEEREREERRRKEDEERARQKAAIEEQAAKVKAEADRIEREKQLEAEKKRLAEEAEKQLALAKEKAEREAKEAAALAERQRQEAAEAERRKKEQEEAERKAELAARPDVDKIRGFGADLLMGLQTMLPEVRPNTPAAKFLANVELEVRRIADECRKFTHKGR